MSSARAVAAWIFGICAGIGCGSTSTVDVHADTNSVTAAGPVTAASQGPGSATTAVAWIVSSGSPDYTLFFGGGTLSGSQFTIEIDREPPVDALNSYGVGVGLILAVDATVSLPTGRVKERDFPDQAIVGGVERAAIIYKRPGTSGLSGWMQIFPVGYSCGRGIPAAPGHTFEGFERVDCGSLELKIDTLNRLHFVNWT